MANINDFFKIYNDLEEEELLRLYDKYCEVSNDPVRIYKMTEFNDYVKKEIIEPLDLIYRISFYNFSVSDIYFSFTEKNEIISFTNIKDWRSPAGFKLSNKIMQLTAEQQSEILNDFIL